MLATRLLTVGFTAAVWASAATAADAPAAEPAPARLPADIEACATLRVDAERLACYDRVVAPQVKGGIEAPAGSASAPLAPATPSPAASSPATSAARPKDDAGLLDEFWELSPDRKRGTFNFNGYRPNYFFPLQASNRVNLTPSSPSAGHSGQLPDYHKLEAKLQISLRTKVVEGLLLPDADLWFAYTQQSLWQIYSGAISRPFRSTDHEPELIYVVPARVDLGLGWKMKMIGLALAHQSNGQALPYSRSWNRLYALGGFENGQFSLTARYNERIHESAADDDNPDFTAYRGRSELLGVWSPGEATLSALWKTNFDSRGSLQIDWTTPVNRKDPKGLRWYVQAFTGYAETLIDYNFRQTSVGAGVTLFGW